MLVETFANRLKQALIMNNMKQSELAEKAKLDKSLISNYISGNYKAKKDKIAILAKILNVNEMWLEGYDVNPDNKTKIIGLDETIAVSRDIGNIYKKGETVTPREIFNKMSQLESEIEDKKHRLSKLKFNINESSSTDGVYIQKADGTSVFLKNASGADKALVELPEEQKKAILAMIGKTMDEIDKELDGE